MIIAQRKRPFNSVAIVTTYVQLIKVVPRHTAHLVERTFYSMCSRHNGFYEAIQRDIRSSA